MGIHADDYYSTGNPQSIFICESQGFPDRGEHGEIQHTLLCGHEVSFPTGSEYAKHGFGSRPHHVPCRTCIDALHAEVSG